MGEGKVRQANRRHGKGFADIQHLLRRSRCASNGKTRRTVCAGCSRHQRFQTPEISNLQRPNTVAAKPNQACSFLGNHGTKVLVVRWYARYSLPRVRSACASVAAIPVMPSRKYKMSAGETSPIQPQGDANAKTA